MPLYYKDGFTGYLEKHYYKDGFTGELESRFHKDGFTGEIYALPVTGTFADDFIIRYTSIIFADDFEITLIGDILMDASLTLYQTRDARIENNESRYYINSEIRNAVNIDSRLFVLLVEDDSFVRVATVADITLIPDTKNRSIATGNIYYRVSGISVYYTSVISAISAAALLKEDVNTVAVEMDSYLTSFNTEGESTAIPLIDNTHYQDLVDVYEAAYEERVLAEDTLEQSERTLSLKEYIYNNAVDMCNIFISLCSKQEINKELSSTLKNETLSIQGPLINAYSTDSSKESAVKTAKSLVSDLYSDATTLLNSDTSLTSELFSRRNSFLSIKNSAEKEYKDNKTIYDNASLSLDFKRAVETQALSALLAEYPDYSPHTS